MSIESKILVHHRAINTPKAFESFLEKTTRQPHLQQAAEGDLCWAEIDDEPLVYIYHPDLTGKSLTNEQVEKLYKNNELFTLEQLLKTNSQCNFVLELKDGIGNQQEAFKKILELINKYNAANILFDAFSLQQLNDLKSLDSSIQTSLHTKFLWNGYVLETTYQAPFINIHHCSNLSKVDYFTLSFASSHINLLNLNIDTALAKFYENDKKINFGAIKSVEMLQKVVKSNVKYIYMRNKEVIKYLGLD